MSADTILVAGIVLGAVAFLVRRLLRTRKAGHGGSGCDNCGH
jgi:hypothetical protein